MRYLLNVILYILDNPNMRLENNFELFPLVLFRGKIKNFIKKFRKDKMNLMREAYETFLCQLYKLPINYTYIPMNFISFPETQNLFNQKQIDRFEINPTLQIWAGNPHTQNRIITLHTKNGRTYLVKALYHPGTQQIYPPVL